MRVTIVKTLLVLAPLSFLTGCATQKNIPMPEQFWQGKKDKITVAKTKNITPSLYKTGNQGLLDLAINSVITRSLDDRISKSDETWYQNMPREFAQELRKRNKQGSTTNLLASIDEKTYPSFAAQVGSNELLVLNLEAFGAIRNYYSFIPMGAPKAYCQLSGELIDTATNKVIWRHRATATEEIQGNWDQPPMYPNLTNAIHLAANNAREELLDSFFSGH